MQEITLQRLHEEVARAEAERRADRQKFTRPLPSEKKLPAIDPYFCHADHDAHTTLLTCQNGKETQEDRADVTLVDIDPTASVIDRAVILHNTVAVLSDCLKNKKAGSTLVLNLSWQDETDHNILVANVGDSRSILCCPDENTVTRLTCDHTLLRENERNNVVARGYALIKQCETLIVQIEKTKEIVAEQVGSYLRAEGRGLQMTRSLGDNPHHSASEVFTTTPSLSYIKVPKKQKYYLLSFSDGITDFVSDEEIAAILQNNRTSAKTTLLRITQTAIARGSKDNLTGVISSLRHELPAGKMRLHFVADGHLGEATAEYIQKNVKKCFIHAIELQQHYLQKKLRLMPRELRYLENITRLTESGALIFFEGIKLIKSFHKIEKCCKNLIQHPSESAPFRFLPKSVLDDTEVKAAFDQFKAGNITATEAMFLFFKRLSTIQVKYDAHDFFHSYRKRNVVLCDPASPNFTKGIDDSTSVSQCINALLDITHERVQREKARVQKLLRMRK